MADDDGKDAWKKQILAQNRDELAKIMRKKMHPKFEEKEIEKLLAEKDPRHFGPQKPKPPIPDKPQYPFKPEPKKEMVKGFLDVLKEPKAEKTKVTKPKKGSSALGKWLVKNPMTAAAGLAGAGYLGYKMSKNEQ